MTMMTMTVAPFDMLNFAAIADNPVDDDDDDDTVAVATTGVNVHVCDTGTPALEHDDVVAEMV